MPCPECERFQEMELITSIEHLVIKGVEISFTSKSYLCPRCNNLVDTAETLDSTLESARKAYQLQK